MLLIKDKVTEYSADHIILLLELARELPNLPQDGKSIGYRQAMTLPTQPKSMIVGSGAIGVEFAHFTMQWEQKLLLLNSCLTSFLLKMKTFKQMERSMKSRCKKS
jgi:dihydrolipoamide dehydrogenase